MPRTRNVLQAPTAHVGRWLTASVSVGAALATILASAHSCGVIGDASASRRTIAALSVHWVGLSPAADTAESIGDTLRFIASVTDNRGASLVGAGIDWDSKDTTIASVDSAGVVVTRAPGTTLIGARVGDKFASSPLVVAPRVRRVAIGDSAIRLAEGATRTLTAATVDARGHALTGGTVRWESSDTSIATVDAKGRVRATGAGGGLIIARADTIIGSTLVQVTPVPHQLVVVRGDSQAAPAGGALPEAVAIRVESRRGAPLEGVPLRFTLRHGGSLKVTSAVTDAEGTAKATWTLGSQPGEQRLLANVDGLDTGLTLRAEAEPVRENIRITVSDRDSVVAGAATPLPVSIRVTDSSGRLLPGIPVTWNALDSGSIVARSSRTDSLGEAHALWSLGPRAGAQHARARVGDGRSVPPVLVTARALAGAPAHLMGGEGHGQKGLAGAMLRRPLEVKVVDHLRNGVPGVPVMASMSAGLAADSIVTTDSTGTARFRWTLGPRTGQQQATFRVANLPRITATVHAVPSTPAAIEFIAPPESGRPGKPLPRPIRMVITDAYGNRVTDKQVTFAVSAGSVVPSQAMPGADGTLSTRWKLGAKIGKQTLTASVRGTAVRAVLEMRAR